jgi:hypothetical protein
MGQHLLCAKRQFVLSPDAFLRVQGTLDAYQCFARLASLRHFGFNVSPPRTFPDSQENSVLN